MNTGGIWIKIHLNSKTTLFAFIVESSSIYRVRAKPSKLDTIQLENGFNGIGTSAWRRVLLLKVTYKSLFPYYVIKL